MELIVNIIHYNNMKIVLLALIGNISAVEWNRWT